MKLGAMLFLALAACAPRAAVAPTPQPPPATERAASTEPPAADSEQLRAATLVKLRQYAFEAFPGWAAAHPDKQCPGSLAERDEYMHGPDASNNNDAWDRPLKMICGVSLPPGARGIAVISRGPDGKEGTEDDIKSWE
jgi:hypothetical protein